MHLRKVTDPVIPPDLSEDLAELLLLAEFHQIEPCHIRDPLLGFGLHGIQVEGSATFDEALELIIADGSRIHLDLQGHQDGEEELVHLIQAPDCVLESTEGQVIDDVLDAFPGDG